MNILGIDYGQRKVGISLARTKIAEPLQVIRYRNEKKLLRKIQEIVRREKIDKIVVGISEGEMAQETKLFVGKMKNVMEIPLDFSDETLSTQEAKSLAISARMKRSKRRNLEDAFAATVMLQSYLERNV